MNKEKIIKIVNEEVKHISSLNEPGHDYLHIKRVVDMSLYLATFYECDTFLIHLLALLHDVEDSKLNSNIKVVDILNKTDITGEYKEKIIYMLPFISFSKHPRLESNFPIEGKIVQDADRLDAIGAIGIARAFSYGGAHHRLMYGSNDSTIKHFDDKLLILDQYLNTDKAKEIAKDRMKLLKDFYQEFIKETKK